MYLKCDQRMIKTGKMLLKKLKLLLSDLNPLDILTKEIWESKIERRLDTQKNRICRNNLYVCSQHSEELYRHTTFRNFLRNNPKAVRKYGETKETAALLFPDDIDRYIEYKSSCIEELYRLCGLK